jgi:hypothetical protein
MLVDELTPRQRAWLHQARFGYLRFTGRCMFPVIRPNDRIRIAPCIAPPAIGDLVVFHDGVRLILHRVVRVDAVSRSLVTRGDWRLADDRPIRHEDVIGRFAGLYDPNARTGRPLPLSRRIPDASVRLVVRRSQRLLEFSLRVARRMKRAFHY